MTCHTKGGIVETERIKEMEEHLFGVIGLLQLLVTFSVVLVTVQEERISRVTRN